MYGFESYLILIGTGVNPRNGSIQLDKQLLFDSISIKTLITCFKRKNPELSPVLQFTIVANAQPRNIHLNPL